MSIVNLLPDDYIEQQRNSRANRMCLVLFLVVMTGVITAAIVSERSGQHTQEILDRIEADYTEAARRIEQMHRLQGQKHVMLHKAELTAALQERVPRSHLLAVITNARPQGTSLLKFALYPERTCNNNASSSKSEKNSKFAKAKNSRRAVKPKSVTMTMQVTGLAATDVEVARFIANLARNPLLLSVDLLYSQETVINDVPVREFQVELKLKRNVDAIDAFPAAGDEQVLARTGPGRRDESGEIR
ncbi:MAG: PilN domain-containing protein [Planctomycetota bacterium]|nr:PilN domain-containing protein [Planctomycetota bacterium]